MSKASRRAAKMARKAANVNGAGAGDGIVTGNMAERMTTIARMDKGGPQPSSQLPIHYGGDRRDVGFHGSDHNHGGWPAGGHVGYDDHSGGSYTKGTPAEADTFRCDSEDITAECPIAKTPSVHVPRRLFDEWIALADDNKTEWLAYLIGTYQATGNKWVVEKVYFPPQTATGGHVDVDEDFECHQGTIGAVHSHVRMGVFFSGEDLAHSNWPVEIVINAMGEVKAMIRHKLECGKFAKSYGKVWLIGDAAGDTYAKALGAAFAKGERLRVAKVVKGGGYQPYHPHPPAAGGAAGTGTTEIIPTQPLPQPPEFSFWCTACQRLIEASYKSHWDAAHGGKPQSFSYVSGELPKSEGAIVPVSSMTQAEADAIMDEDAGDFCIACEGHGWVRGGECARCGGTGWEPGSVSAAVEAAEMAEMAVVSDVPLVAEAAGGDGVNGVVETESDKGKGVN